MWGNCEDCKKLDTCNKTCGIMFGGCQVDFEPTGDDDDDYREPCLDEKFYTSANPWDAPGMSLKDFF